jgi:hypothetical protein
MPVYLRWRRGPDRQSHLSLTRIATVDADCCVAPMWKSLNGYNVHFPATLASGTFRAAWLQKPFKPVDRPFYTALRKAADVSVVPVWFGFTGVGQ